MVPVLGSPLFIRYSRGPLRPTRTPGKVPTPLPTESGSLLALADGTPAAPALLPLSTDAPVPARRVSTSADRPKNSLQRERLSLGDSRLFENVLISPLRPIVVPPACFGGRTCFHDSLEIVDSLSEGFSGNEDGGDAPGNSRLHLLLPQSRSVSSTTCFSITNGIATTVTSLFRDSDVGTLPGVIYLPKSGMCLLRDNDTALAGQPTITTPSRSRRLSKEGYGSDRACRDPVRSRVLSSMSAKDSAPLSSSSERKHFSPFRND